jgi:hypothetical protein
MTRLSMTDNWFAGIPCRECGVRDLHLEWRHEGYAPVRKGNPPVLIDWPYCVCRSCGAESRGKPPPNSFFAELERNPRAFCDGPFPADCEN